MQVKTVSTRVGIIGRGAKCRGKSAVERSAYISRTTLYSEYYGETFYPKYAEDLVHTEILVPPHAPKEYLDRNILWNSVEKVEKHAKAQLARSMYMTLPNGWSYDFAADFVRRFVQNQFVSKGMCAEFAIHDSVNKDTGERNLHVHILLTMRPINLDGTWGEKSRKVYKLDKDGNKIKKKNGRYDCTTEKTTDWDRPDFAKDFRKSLVEEINAANEQLGLQDELWEYRSFKDRGLELKPTIHLGEKAAALERKGIQTERGNYNREVRDLNALITKVVEFRRENFKNFINSIGQSAKDAAQTIKNEVLDLIHKAAAKQGRMSSPITNAVFYKKISNRAALSEPKVAEDFVIKNGITTFKQVREYIKEHGKKADEKETLIQTKWQKIQSLKEMAEVYAEYSRLREVVKESRKQSIFTKKKFDKEHEFELSEFDYYDSKLSELLNGGKATPKAWAKEIAEIEEAIPKLREEYNREVIGLATAEVIDWTRRDMERIEANERREQERHISRQTHKSKDEEIS